MQEEIDQVRRREKYEYNTKLQNLHEQQTKLSEENKNILLYNNNSETGLIRPPSIKTTSL